MNRYTIGDLGDHYGVLWNGRWWHVVEHNEACLVHA